MLRLCVDRVFIDRLVPYALFIDLELGRVGMTEAEARRRGLRVRVAQMPAEKIPRAMTSGEHTRLLEGGSGLRQRPNSGGVDPSGQWRRGNGGNPVAMRAGLPFTALRDMVFAHPTMAEGLNDLFDALD